MEALEINDGGEIRDFVAARLNGLIESYSILKVGHITRIVEPISGRAPLSTALEALSSQAELGSLPVDGERGIVGIVHRRELQKKRSALASMTDPPVEKFLDASAQRFDASESCETALSLILGRDPERLYDDFMIFERGRFLGLGTFADLTRNISKIREVDLGKAKAMQEFLMSRNSIAGRGIVAERYQRMVHGIGGDYTQCMDIREGLSLLACFDVCGKGTAAALVTSVLSSFFSTLKVSGSLPGLSPLSILQSLNAVVMDQTPEELFIAAALVFLDREHGEATFFNCGFPPLYAFYTEDGSGKPKGRIVNPGLWPLGINEFTEPRGSAFPIYRNLRVFIHTDGLTDARNESGERYEQERLRQFLYPRCMKGARAIVGELAEELSAYIGSAPLADDITALVAEVS